MNSLVGVIGVVALYLLVNANGQQSRFPSECRGISRGRDFVVAFTSNLQNSVGELHILVVAFSDNPTTVTISSKHKVNSTNYQVNFEIPARGFRRTTIPYDFLLQPTDDHSDKVLRVTASSDVSVYGMNYEPFSTDAFLALPNVQLGTHYIATSIRTIQTGAESSVIGIAGLEDNTEIQVLLTSSVRFNATVYNAGDILHFSVNSDEAAQVIGLRGADLSGSIIRSSSPIVAYSGHQCANTASSYCDILSEQLIPVNSWGSTHIYTATGTEDDTSIFRIFAFLDGTIISVPGFPNRTLNSGEFWEVQLSGYGVISSNFPSKVVQILRFISGSLVDPSIIQVPSEEQFAFVFGFTTPPKSGGDGSGFFNFVNIVVKANECNTVTTNGQRLPCATTAVPIPGTEYVVVTQQLPKGEGVYFIEQSSSKATSPMSVIVYGYEDDETYGYAAGLSLPSEGRLLSISPFVVNENGGDVLTTTLPCAEQMLPNQGKARCRFRQASLGLETIIDGIFQGFYQVLCPTFPFKSIGLMSLEISIDNGLTYPYSDTIYVASEDVLQPKVTFEGSENNFEYYIDFTKEDTQLTIQWNPLDFEDATHVHMSMIVLTNDDDKHLMWVDEILLQQSVANSGRVTFGKDLITNVKRGRKKRQEQDPVRHNIDQLVIRLRNEEWLVSRTTKKAITAIEEDRNGRDPCTAQLPVLMEHHPLPQLPPCPCDNEQAGLDNRYTLSNFGIGFFHRGSQNCYRRGADGSSAGVQCCYNDMGDLILDPNEGAGSADAFSPTVWDTIFTKKHFEEDVVPWVACCLLSNIENACERYFTFRPPTDCTGYDRPGTGTGTGDPHIITLDQTEYTFNGVGEFILLESTLHDVIFQGRMEKLSGRNASVFTAFAMRGDLSPAVQVGRSPEGQTLVLINGTQFQVTHGNEVIPRFSFEGFHIDLNGDLSKLRVTYKFGLSIEIVILSKIMSYTVFLSEKFKGKTRGLLGNFNDDPNDDFILPNGDILSTNSSLQQIHYDFGLKWGLEESKSIFTYLPPNDFEVYNNPRFAPSFLIPTLSEVSNEIKDTCGLNFACLFDAVNSGDISLANQTISQVSSYYETRTSLNKIVNCWFPENFENGKIKGGVYYVNSSYQLSCLDGYYLIGSDVNYCASDGQWSNDFPSCINNFILFGLPAALLCILILLITITVVIKCCCRSQKNIV